MGATDELRSARERAGLSIDQAADKTRIPKKYLEALERGDLSAFPPGPFLSGYTRQYRKFLTLPETPTAAPEPEVRLGPAPKAAPRITPGGVQDFDDRTVTVPSILKQSRGRLFALAGALLAVIVLVIQVGRSALEPAPTDIGEVPDQNVLLRVTEPVRAEVVADGRTVFHGLLTPGPDAKFAAHDRLELDLGSLEPVTIQYNGSALKPLGAQSRPRRLVFVDDRTR